MSNRHAPSHNGLQTEFEAARQRIVELEGELLAVRQPSSPPGIILGQPPHILLEKVLSSLNEAVLIVDPSTRTIADCNRTAEEVFGYPRQAMIGKNTGFIHVDENMFQQFGREMRQSFADKGYFETLFRLKRKNHEVFPTENFVTPVYDEDGDLLAVVSVIRDITDRKQAEKARSESERRFKDTFEQAAVGIAHTGTDGSWLRVNKKFCGIVGYSREELLKRTFQEITHPDDLEADLNFLRQTLAGEIDTFTMEKRYIQKSGSIVWVHLTVSLVRDEQNEPEYFIGVIEDISQGKAAENALRENEERYRQVVEGTDDIITRVDLQGRFTYVNHAAVSIFGLNPTECLGLSAFEFIHPDDRERTRQAFEEWMEKRVVNIAFENCQVSRSGEVRHILWTCNPLYDEQEKPLGFMGIGHDITERKRLNQERRLLEEKYAKAFDTSLDAFAISTLETGAILDVNQGFVLLTGYSKEEAIGRSSLELNLLWDASERESVVDKLRRDGQVKNIELRIRSKSGECIHGLFAAQILYLMEGPCIFTSLRDITERKRLEQERRSLEDKYSKAFNFSPNILSISALETGTLFEVNRAFEVMTGYSREEALGKSSLGLNLWWNVSDRAKFAATVRKEGRVRDLEVQIRSKSGECIHGLVAAEVLLLEDQPYILSSFRDITERKKAEQALQDKEEVLQQQARDMEEMNAALTVLLARRDQEKQTYEKNALNTLKTLVFPFLEKLSASDLSPAQESCLATVIANLNSVYSPFAGRLAFRGRGLTPSEIHIVELIRQGRSSKEIAQSLGLSAETILTHRKNIRAKFGLQNQKINLFSFLQSLESEPHD